MLIPTESQEAIALIHWASFHHVCKNYLIHNPNEGKRSIVTGRRMKREGLKPGVSDYFLAYPCNGKPGLWIELKRRKNGVLSQKQSEFINRMREVGYEAYVAYGWEEAKAIIEKYLHI